MEAAPLVSSQPHVTTERVIVTYAHGVAGTSALTPLVARYFAGELSVHEHETDQRIIDAVLAELLVTPLSKLSLEAVADRAGLTRMTLYRRFGDRQRVIEATFAREVSRFFDGLLAADDPGAPPGDRIADAFATALTLTHRHPVVEHMLTTNPSQLLDTLLGDDGFLLAAGSAFIADQIEPQRRSGATDRQRTGELLARLFVALVLTPPPSVDFTDPAEARELARELVVPLVVRY